MTDLLVPVASSTLQQVATQMGIVLAGPEFTKPHFVSTDFKSEFRPDQPEEEYHSDLTAVNRGDVVHYLTSPMHFVSRRGMRDKDEESDALRFGRAAHALLLEPARFKREFLMRPDFGDLRTKEGKLAKAAWEEVPKPVGAIQLSGTEMQTLFGIAQGIARNKTAMLILEGGKVELTTYYRDPITGLKCRTKPDLVNRDLGALVDFKTYTHKDGATGFHRSAVEYQYPLQLAMYREGYQEVTREKIDSLAIVASLKIPPYTCTVFYLDDEIQAYGLKQYRDGLSGIARRLESNYWHDDEEMLPLSLPPWKRGR